jgi:branched-chain amino acid transport system substrate-binding protein
MKRKTFRVVAVCFSLLMIGGLAITGNALAADTIRLGFVADISGIGAVFYKGQKAAIDLFIEEANASGGVLGKKLELVVRDAQLKPDIGANMARELILSEKCDFLIGPTSSAVALAVTKVANEFKKIVYFHTSNAEALTTTDFQPYMFQVVPNTGIEGRGMARVLAQKPIRNTPISALITLMGTISSTLSARNWLNLSRMPKCLRSCGSRSAKQTTLLTYLRLWPRILKPYSAVCGEEV